MSSGIRRFDVVLEKIRNWCIGVREYLFKISSIYINFVYTVQIIK